MTEPPAALVGPHMYTRSLIVLDEGSEGTYFCTSSNHPDLNTETSWVAPIGVQRNPDGVAVDRAVLMFFNASRHHAGEYMCTVKALDGRSLTTSVPVIVNCEYILLEIEALMMIH